MIMIGLAVLRTLLPVLYYQDMEGGQSADGAGGVFV